MLEWLWLLLGALPALLRSRRDLALENLLLRQQLSVAVRARPRPRLRRRDRLFWVVARRLGADWRCHLVLVQPETVLGWHRRGWRLYWWWRSGRPTGRPRVPPEVRALIRRLAEENRLWGTERIRGELLKLGIAVGNGSIRRYRWRPAPRPPSQTWAPSTGTTPTRSGQRTCSPCRRSRAACCSSCSSSRTTAGSSSTSGSPPTRRRRGSGGSSSRRRRGVAARGTCCAIATRSTAGPSPPRRRRSGSTPC